MEPLLEKHGERKEVSNPVTAHSQAASIEDVSVNHRRFHVLMSEQFLHGAMTLSGSMVTRSFIPLPSRTLDEGLGEVHILDVQPHALHQPQATAVKQTSHQTMRT